MIQPVECGNPPVYDETNKLIFEFFELNGLEETMEAFAKECEAKSLPCPKVVKEGKDKAAFSSYEADRMLQAFDEGDLTQFMKLWEIFQTHIQVTTDDMKKLEVYIRVHFALWPRVHAEAQSVQTEAMNSLKVFFEEQSPALSGDPTILPLFALPYVTDPSNHAVFKDLLQANWTEKLRGQLESTVLKYFELLQQNICNHSRLVELLVKGERYEGWKTVSKAGNGQSLEASYHQDRFYQLLAHHKEIRKLLQGTRESYAKLLLVESELVGALEASVNKNTEVSLDPVFEKCYGIFPEIFTPKDDSNTGKPDVEYFKRLTAGASFDPTQDSDVSLFFLGISDLSPESLDYQKIKDTLVSEGVPIDEKLCLLQALRWMVTKTKDKCREFSMDAFVANDLLGIAKKSDYRNQLFQCLLSPHPNYHKECFARLVNTLCSTRKGRIYISQNNFTVDILVKSLQTFKLPNTNESFICQMIVASLQKLSLKKNMRLFMIKHNVIRWLVGFIKAELAHHSLTKKGSTGDIPTSEGVGNDSVELCNPYLMEYGWALLMNLCLHEEAWDSCRASGTDILSASANMLITIPRSDMAPYVVSTLFSLLRSPEMFSLAKSMKIETAFTPLLAEGDDIAEHLDNLVSLLYTPGADRISSTRDTNYDDEENVNPDPDVFEPELELPESWTNSLDDRALFGDDLLLREFLSQKDDPVVPVPLTDTDPIKGVIVRPETPSKQPNKAKEKSNKMGTEKQVSATAKNSKTGVTKSKSKVTNSKTGTSIESNPKTPRANSATKSNKTVNVTPKGSKVGVISNSGSKPQKSSSILSSKTTLNGNVGDKKKSNSDMLKGQSKHAKDQTGLLDPGLPITIHSSSDQ